MASLQVIEQLFKICHEFKVCEQHKDPEAEQPCHCSQHGAAKVEELVKNLKGQVEPFRH
jgi:hypothetical protein